MHKPVTRASQIRRALPRVAQVVVGLVVVTVAHQDVLRILGLVLVGSALVGSPRQWWQYVVTGQSNAVWKPEAIYAEPGSHLVTLVEVGPRPIEVIKAIREVCGADLLGAKILAEGVPSTLVDTVSLASATAAQERLVRVGAQVVVATTP